MAKLDEIMEVLSQEIDGFNTSIDKLEKLSEKFNDLKIEADTSKLELQFKDFLSSQKTSSYSYEKRMDEISKKIEKSRWTPKWEMVMLYFVIAVNTLAFGYLGYYFINYEKKMQNAILKTKNEGLGKASGYFNDHPIIYKDFQKWVKKKDSVPNQK